MTEYKQSSECELGREASESLFLLRKSSSNSTGSIQVDFSPLSQPSQMCCTPTKTLPIFNSDGKFFTPSFVLQVDQKRYSQNSQIYLNLHNRKTAQMSQQKTDLFVPKPSKNNSFCCVCKMPFEDYLTHVNIPKHQLLMKKSDYYTRIYDLCAGFKGKAESVGKVERVGKVESAGKTEIKKKRGRPCKSSKTKPIRKGDDQKSISGKHTSTEDSVKIEQMPIQMLA